MVYLKHDVEIHHSGLEPLKYKRASTASKVLALTALVGFFSLLVQGP